MGIHLKNNDISTLYSTDNSCDIVISACAVQLYANSHTGQIMITNMNLCIINIRHIKVVLLFICPQEDQTRVSHQTKSIIFMERQENKAV